MKEEIKVVCPKCGSKLMLIREIDWDNLVTYCHPLCTNTLCCWTTRRTFDTAEQAKQYIKDLEIIRLNDEGHALLDLLRLREK